MDYQRDALARERAAVEAAWVAEAEMQAAAVRPYRWVLVGALVLCSTALLWYGFTIGDGSPLPFQHSPPLAHVAGSGMAWRRRTRPTSRIGECNAERRLAL